MVRISLYIHLLIITVFILLCPANGITTIKPPYALHQSTNMFALENLTTPPQRSVSKTNITGFHLKNSEIKILASIPPSFKILTNPIHIDGNDEFHTQASEFSWPGDGSPENPYLIDGYTFTGDPESELNTPIDILNVNLHFIISNCVLNNSDKGIVLRNLGNCQILNNVINNSWYGGIHTYWVDNSVISNNTIINTDNYMQESILLQNCKNNTISNNVITKGHSDGIGVKSSPNNLIIKNYIYDIFDDFEPSWGIKIVFNSDNCVVVNNSIDNTKAGILIHSCNNTTLIGNLVMNNRGFQPQYAQGAYHTGISCNGWNLVLINNTVINNSIGIWIDSGYDHTILHNFLSNNYIGIKSWWYDINNEFGSKINLINIIGNIISTNDYYAIYIDEGSTGFEVRSNTFVGNGVGTSQAFDSGIANLFTFNYWDDWVSPDADSDGFIDVAYAIDGSANNFDPFPTTNVSHLLVPPKIILPISEEISNDVLFISWFPAIDTQGHSIKYSLFYSMNNEAIWNLITSELTETEYSWSISSLRSGTVFKIKVVATCSEGLSVFDITNISLRVVTQQTSLFPNILIMISLLIGIGLQRRKSYKLEQNKE